MAFKHGLSERLDELRFPSPRSPPSESAFPGYSSLSPGHSNFVSGFSSRPAGDVRANLQRRFTTDSSKFSSWNYLNQGPSSGPAQDPLDLLSSIIGLEGLIWDWDAMSGTWIVSITEHSLFRSKLAMCDLEVVDVSDVSMNDI